MTRRDWEMVGSPAALVLLFLWLVLGGECRVRVHLESEPTGPGEGVVGPRAVPTQEPGPRAPEPTERPKPTCRPLADGSYDCSAVWR